MTEGATPGALLAQLREGTDCAATDPATQRLFEAWAARECWCARSEALPLLVGVSPSAWAAHLARRGLTGAELALWSALARDLSLELDADQALEPRRLRAWAQGAGLRLPTALARLLDFITSVLPTVPAGDAMAADEVLRAQERETVLGAALMLVTRQPAECVDDEGCYDSARIAQLIRSRALLWFPLAPPSLSEAEMAALVARWVAHSGRR
jgi:hypothetical protein